MNNFEQLQKLKKELLETSNENSKSIYYKMKLYEKYLDEFKKNEREDFFAKVTGTPTNEKEIKEDEILKALASGIIDNNMTFGDLEMKISENR